MNFCFSLPIFLTFFFLLTSTGEGGGPRVSNPRRAKTENSSRVRRDARTRELDPLRTKTATTGPEISHFQQDRCCACGGGVGVQGCEGGEVHVSIDENVIRDKPIFLSSVVDKYCPILLCQSPSAIKWRPHQPTAPPNLSLPHTWMHRHTHTHTYHIKAFMEGETQKIPGKKGVAAGDGVCVRYGFVK